MAKKSINFMGILAFLSTLLRRLSRIIQIGQAVYFLIYDKFFLSEIYHGLAIEFGPEWENAIGFACVARAVPLYHRDKIVATNAASETVNRGPQNSAKNQSEVYRRP
jgi:hypothetical protein